MTNEAVIRYFKNHKAVDRTVADGADIEKGVVLKLTDSNTAIASSGSGDVFAGIAAREKIANDGRTQLSAWMEGVFDMTVASGASITTGEWVSTSGANVIKTATEAEIAAGKAIGRAREDGEDSEVIQVAVGGSM